MQLRNRTVVAALALVMHTGTRHMARLFGGRFGDVPVVDPMPVERLLPVSAGALHALTWEGEGIPLVMLHGLDVNAWIWARVGHLLRGSRPLVLLTGRGHGLSTAPPDDVSLARTTDDLVRVLDGLGVDRVHLAGHSWGGKIGFYAAARLGYRVVSLFLADPVPPEGLSPLLQELDPVVHAAFLPERRPYPCRDAWERGMTDLVYHQIKDAIDARMWADAYREMSDGSYRNVVSDDTFDTILYRTFSEDTLPLAPRVLCPVALARPTLSVASGRWVDHAQWHPAVDVETHRVAGDHCFVHTNPRDTAALLDDFVRRAEGDTGSPRGG